MQATEMRFLRGVMRFREAVSTFKINQGYSQPDGTVNRIDEVRLYYLK